MKTLKTEKMDEIQLFYDFLIVSVFSANWTKEAEHVAMVCSSLAGLVAFRSFRTTLLLSSPPVTHRIQVRPQNLILAPACSFFWKKKVAAASCEEHQVNSRRDDL